ncbi:E3 ubiquitin ligase complex SCF subunit, putative [Candida dubliniensis CD36]|uniref:E3 ubiquitin ligase complex SCF subunit, putative n=1 Tax=Candida dubliniensis (strain CD36 / ATCC MYA-646 / CBS 7987 / NCPF 3949 / NRRL Y-17841) TaxID=573826 RepID=B9WK74_CANDC|nr:E3 ubiquitin ligase complex SCF subunit, putative [Candida dubliniensis CD36]CAX40726.1 E3 ubiquitin ligase complex SCF subunit, putative [Candida dubliniensis CD36]
MSSKSAAAILQRQYKDLTDPKKGIPSFHIELDDDNIFLWNIGVMVLNPESLYHGGYFKGQMRFPQDFPFSPPSFRFTPALYHPNVYRDGRLCISILHQGGDPTSDEPESETWSPAQTVESVLISIISLLDDPNGNSPANIDASVEFRKNYNEYKKKVLQEVERSKKDIPEDFIMPETSDNAYSNYHNLKNKEVVEEPVDEDFWYESEEEESFDEESLMDENMDDQFEDDDEEEEDDEDEDMGGK